MLFGVDCYISRSGYTGEDGYEISVPAAEAERVWNTMLEDARVKPIGLGARDSLRLEAGLPLHGHDIDATDQPGRGRPDLRPVEVAQGTRRLQRRRPHPEGTGRRPGARPRRPERQGRRPGP